MPHRLRTVLAAAVLTIAAVGATALPASAAPNGRDLAAARAATAAFHNPAKAIAAGFRPSEECVSVPGLGVMGQHWVNRANVGSLDPARPAALLYMPTAGGPKLIAVEWIMPTTAPVVANPEAVDPNGPALFGQRFNGIMAEHGADTGGNHWDLHVWTWRHNPAGTFAQFNPSRSVSC